MPYNKPATSSLERAAVPASELAPVNSVSVDDNGDLEWVTKGPYVGASVMRDFKDGNFGMGSVTHYAPPGADIHEDPPLWHVVHEDGDEEDLEVS